MHKRKKMGLLPYGNRAITKATVKFQAGGAVAVSKGYDYRDDPYELMLLQNKAKAKTARIKAGSKTSTSKIDVGTFETIQGGLQVDNDIANQQYRQVQAKYYDAVEKNGIEWVKSVDGQRMFQNVINVGATLENKIKGVQKDFEEASASIEMNDKDTYAISSAGNMFVLDNTTHQPAIIRVDDYVGESIDKYTPQTVNDFISWRRTKQSGDGRLTDEFLRAGAFSANKMKENYIEPNEDQLQYVIMNNKLVPKGSDKPIGDVTQIMTGLMNMFEGKEFTLGTGLQPGSSSDAVKAAANSIFGDLMNKSGDRSRLDASLSAELLRDDRYKAALHNISGKEERLKFFQDRKKILLLSKILDKNGKGIKSGSTEPGSGETAANKAKGSELLGFNMSLFDGTKISKYSVHKNTIVEGDANRVSEVNLPILVNSVSVESLKVSDEEDATPDQLRQNKLTKNARVAAISDLSEIYTESGIKLSSLLGGSANVSDFIGQYTTMTPNVAGSTLLVPVNSKGETVMKEMESLKGVKLEARKAFIASYNKHNKDKITTDPSELFPGNMEKQKQEDYAQFLLWAKLGVDAKKHAKKYLGGDKSANSKLIYEMSKDSSEFILSSVKKVKAAFKGEAITMRPMHMFSIVSDSDEVDLAGRIERATKGSYGEGLVKDATPAQKKFLQKTNEIDVRTYNPFTADKVHTMNVLVPMKDPTSDAMANEQQLAHVAAFKKINDKMMISADRMSTVSDATSINNLFTIITQ